MSSSKSKSEAKPASAHETTSEVSGARGDGVREKLSRQKKISGDQIGLKVLYQAAETEDIEIDIVAIHGIGANPEYTWVCKETQVNWLSDPNMLPAALPNARIMCYNYESYWFGENALRQSLRAVAEKILIAYKEMREDCPHRPIIFIGHCFGGLVAQQCYIVASMHKTDYSGISDSMAGMVFLGTPHHGIHSDSGMQTMGEVYKTIAESNVQIQDNVLNTLTQDNDVLVGSVQTFTRLLHNLSEKDKFTIFCFFEQKACNIGSVAGISNSKRKFLVTESSGTLAGHGKEALPLDHFEMNKFGSKNDNNYLSVRRQILEMNKRAKALCEGRGSGSVSLGIPPNTQVSSTRKQRISSLAAPISKEDNFAQRGGILDLIEEKFRNTSSVALYGLPGNGKTHIAVEYAHKFFQDQHGAHVHWVNAGSAAEFELSYKRIAETLHINRDRTKDHDVLETVYETLNQDSGHWLMVLDGLNDKTKLELTSSASTKTSLLDFVPRTPLSRVLTTTREKTLAMRMVNQKANYAIKVSTLKDADASFVLLGKATTDPTKMQRTASKAKELGGSAGTIILAYFYQKITAVSLKRYMELIRSSSSTKETPMIMRAWQLLFELIKEKHEEAADLLLLIGSLDVQCIPVSFFERDQFLQLRTLEDYGMVEPSADGRVVTVTAVFRQCVQTYVVENDEREVIEQNALSVLCDKFQDTEHRAAEVLLPCALAVLRFQSPSLDCKRQRAILHTKVARFYTHIKQYQLAAEHWKRTISLCEEDPKNDPVMLEDARHKLKEVLARNQVSTTEIQGKATVKEDVMTKRGAKKKTELLEIEKSAGLQHFDTIRKASDVANFQLIHGSEGETRDSIKLYKRVLEWCEEKQGDDSIDMARHKYNLALAYERQGDFDEAEKLYGSALKTAGQHLGTSSPESLKILANLACLYCKQGRFQDAEKAFKSALLGQQKALGADHPDTLVTRQNIAIILGDRGQVDAAVDELEQILRVQAHLLGHHHPATLRTSCSLAMMYGLQGSTEKAESLFKATHRVQKQLHGKTHPDTAQTELMMKELLQQMKI